MMLNKSGISSYASFSQCVVMSHSSAIEIAEDARQLRSTLARLRRRLRAERSDMGIGLAKYGALGCLYRSGPMTAGELAAHERLQPQSVTRILADLARRKLIARTPDPSDRRRSRIEITALGLATLHEHVREQEAWLTQALSTKLTTTERDVLRLAVHLIERLMQG